jgi:hypothetical protein
METSKTLLEKAMFLKTKDRFLLIDGLIRSIDKPDAEIDIIWTGEAEKRLNAHREGRSQPVSYDNVFGEEIK